MTTDLHALRDRLVAEAHADPLDPVARFDLAVALRLLGQLDAARAVALDALALGAPVAPTRALLGLLDLFALRPADALGQLQRALAADPDHAVSWVYLGLAHGALGARTDALAAFDRALHARRLPAIVQSRVASQRDALADAPDATLLGSRCAVCAVTEWITAGGPTPDAPAPPPSRAPASASPLLGFDELVDRIDAAARVVVLSGAGLSAESGLPTRKALWALHARDEAVSVAGFVARPTALWDAARTFAGDAMPAPNAGHLALARLPQVVAVVTQNIDGLHQRASRAVDRSTPVIELHGSFDRARCHDCGAPDAATAWELLHHGPELPRCAKCGGPLRPDVVLFGETVADAALADAAAQVRAADLLLVVGCAMDVAPASELPCEARAVIELNRNPSRLGRRLGIPRYEGVAGETLAAAYARIAARRSLGSASFPAAVTTAERPLRRRVVVSAPTMGDGATEVTLVERMAPEGARVTRDTVLAVVGGDKVDVDLFAPVDGVIHWVVTALDARVPVGTRLAVIDPLPGAVAVEAAPMEPRPVPLPTLPWGDAGRAALIEQFTSWRHRDWLRPDAGLLDATPPVRRWLEERADEHRSALGGDLPPLRVEVFGDLATALERWRAAPIARCGWDRQLALALDAVAARLDITRDPKLPHRWQSPSALRAYCNDVWAAVLRSECARRGITPGPRLLEAPLAVVFDLALGVLDGAGASRGPCPWAPLVAILARGGWPFALAPDALGVYVPRAAELVAGVLTIAQFPPRAPASRLACLSPLTLDRPISK